MIPESEDGWAYDGPLSTLTEWHALITGLAAGTATVLTGNPLFVAVTVAVALGLFAVPHPKLRELKREPWYAAGGTLPPVALDGVAGVLV